MTALSPAQADQASLWLVIFLAALLAVSLAAVIMSPPQPGSPPADRAGAGPGLPEPGDEPPTTPLPRRVVGQSGLAYPAQVQYGGQVIDTRTGRTWRCPHNHPTEESAISCADALNERIKRLGWDKATGERL
jgi:hypothetical protein